MTYPEPQAYWFHDGLYLRLLKALSKWMFARGSAIGIDRLDDERYLDRHYLYRNPGKKGHLLHTFKSSDPDDPHDHPWNNRTFILHGAYHEDIFVPSSKGPILTGSHLRTPGYYSGWRPAEQVHRIRLIDKQPVWTLFSYKNRRQDWYFHLRDGTILPGEDSSKTRTGGVLEGRFLPRMLNEELPHGQGQGP